MNSNKTHWEKVYTTKQPDEVSWTQEVPQISLDLIHALQLPKTAAIIDIGGGDSKLVDYLLDEKFEHITVLDISAQALDRAKARLGERASKVNWIVADITTFEPSTAFDLWHDRAAFHFLTDEAQISKYLATARKSVKNEGYAIIGTFSTNGPEKCSGLPIKQYDESSLSAQLNNGFEKINAVTENHITPFNTTQHFLFCSFKRQVDRP